MPSPVGRSSEAAASTDSDSLAKGPITTDALFVDLDGTLVSTDVFGESLLLAARQHPRLLLKLVGKLFKGPAAW